MKIRLDKYLADMKLGTRSEVKSFIKKGLIKVNGDTVKAADLKVDTDTDAITYNDKSVNYTTYEYIILNKPSGVITATEDKKQSTVLDIIKSNRKDLFPVGRLDIDTEGLLLITNDGELAHKMLAPKSHVDKTYFAIVKGHIDETHVELFSKGFKVDDSLTALPAKLSVLSYDKDDDVSHVNITIHEGKFHQIKRMFIAIDSEVIYLKRISFGPLVLGDLAIGSYRELTEEELMLLKKQ